REAIKIIDDEQFVVMNGDSFLDIDFNLLNSYHERKRATATIALTHTNNTDRYGRVEINKKGEITKFTEKDVGRSGFINSGVYVFNYKIINTIPDGNTSLETRVLPYIINQGLYGMPVEGFFTDIGIPQSYLCLLNNPEKMLNAVGL
ncbi:MAG TPA: sugar phosphate nucleotidyltransferase, partial [Candidatus Brocadiales bacterium]|nr:sugar phosphate nucleotidyltransferase [Candidatus Brocadiales bacterium]